jgi:predicted porin
MQKRRTSVNVLVIKPQHFQSFVFFVSTRIAPGSIFAVLQGASDPLQNSRRMSPPFGAVRFSRMLALTMKSRGEHSMKKSLLALAALAGFAGVAHAQSSVTLYGIIDGGITYTNKQQTTGLGAGSSAWQTTSGNLYGSRWGLKGSEDLGGGLKAVFDLENGFNLFNGRLGQGGQEFGRQAYVGVQSDQFGTVTLGRQYDSFSDFIGAYASSNDWASGFGSHFGDLDNVNQSIRLNNSIKFVSNNYNGLSFGGIFSFGNVAGAFQQNRAWAAGISYAMGPFSVGGGYLDLHNPLAVSATGVQSGPYAPNASYEGSLTGDYVGLQNADSQRTFGVGGSYAIGPATVNLMWTRTRLDNSRYYADLGVAGTDVRMDSYEVNGKYAVTDAWNVGVAYIFNNGKVDVGDLKPRFHQVNLGTNYALSKRTSLYAIAIYQKAAGDGIVPDAVGGLHAVAATPALADSTSDKQVSVTVGVKHSF